MTHREFAHLRKLAVERGGTIQGEYQGPKHEPIVPISIKCERCGLIFAPTPSGNCPQCDLIQEVSKKPRKKLEPKKQSLAISNPDTKGVIVCVKNNKAVKYWRT